MNEDFNARISHPKDEMSTLEDPDELDAASNNTSSGNILENFPYLRNDGLGQMQAQQSLIQKVDGSKIGSSHSKSDKDLSHNFTLFVTKPRGPAPTEVNSTTYQVSVPASGKKPTLQQMTSSQHTHLNKEGQRMYEGTRSVVKMETPSCGIQFSSFDQQSQFEMSGKTGQRTIANLPVHSTNTQSHAEDKNDDPSINLRKAKRSLSEQTSESMYARPKIQFLLKGKLGHDIDSLVKSVRQIMIEPVDVEEKLVEDFVYSYPKQIKTEPVDEPGVVTQNTQSVPYIVSTAGQFTQPSWSAFHKNTFQTNLSVKETTANSTDTVTKTVTSLTSEASPVSSKVNNKHKGRYTEPSIAEIRASVLGSSECTQNISGLHSDSSYGKGVKVEVTENAWKDLTSDENLESEINEERSDKIGCGTSIRNFAGTKRPNETTENSPLAKKGGRSNPENPFALTSPSFHDSTAKALMTTTQTSTATIVMISIMSIGSRAKLLPKIINSKAAEGGLISIINPVEPPGNKHTQVNNEEQISSEITSIMSKLRREKSQSGEDSSAANTNIDRLDVNIKIDDNQYVGHGENKRWLCKICPKSYTTKHNLVAHILDHGDIKPHLCLVCEKYFKQLSHLNTHMLTHDNVKPYVCSLCDKGFTQISHLKRHETVHMGSKPYICDICNRGFAFPSELRLHKEKHVSASEKCTDCDLEFSSWNELQEHMVTFNHCSDLQCNHCDRIFRFPSQLRDHMMSHAGSRPYICTECGMDFMKEHHLKSHQFTHTGLRPYVCPDCGRSFNQKANMQRHLLIHNAERAYKCEECNKTFTQPQTLKAHMVVHSETKPYKCNICGKQFGRQHNLQGHMHIHSDSKPYSCSICQASFTLKGNLNRHKKVKHDLDESTEVMEEDAVNFLSTISDRARENYYAQSDSEIDPDSRDGISSLESRSSRKGRKSVPRKHVSRQVFGDDDGDDSRSSGIEMEKIITYSDEERENDRTSENTSKYFSLSEKGSASCRRKRKRDVVCRVQYDDGSDGHDDTDEQKGQDVQKIETDDTERNVSTETRSTRKRKKKDYGDDFTET